MCIVVKAFECIAQVGEILIGWHHVGYMVSRMLGAVPVLADAIVEQLCRASDAADAAHLSPGAASEPEAEQLSAAVWASIWPIERCASAVAATIFRGNSSSYLN